MDEEFKKKWVASLRSGEYKQTKGALKTEKQEFCCLGVACDISKLGTWETSGYVKREAGQGVTNLEMFDYIYAGEKSSFSLAYKMRTKLGLSYQAVTVLVGANDDGVPFDKIADYIELNL